ncbi:dynein-related subfamily AAA family protein [Paraburkholderia eburnea]|uniref:Dynein-related subfamily AAA family protein n=1 Tax=Paraburkholderia eburnea TaxID=1189126 RepID=A0A2S4LX55_9BURK|nr:AAA family ATPase [Paraburkholderia eburnea]POR47042.1 dynein-related subfamily AAA family protein [Paraburkholderia eburnea]PRZ18272.1 dynein-related subfamily AAA family protein [Paraburkholderia eburnea]
MADINESQLVDSGAIPPTDFHQAIERIREVAQYDLELPADFDARLKHVTSQLVVSEDVLRAVSAAIRVGHVVLQGPPGTGKSSLVRALAKAFNVSTFAVTAHEDWTIYDVIGRLELRLTEDRKEEITPVNGALTEAVIRCGNNVVQHFDDPSHPQAEWLLIDELNRAHLDKAFGELFSVLGTDELVPINLPHQKDGNRELVIPKRFRIIATLNSYDKQFVQSLSQAIRRRFTFISLDVPPKKSPTDPWMFDISNSSPAIREFSYVIQRAAQRIASRECSMTPGTTSGVLDEIVEDITSRHLGRLSALFDIVESIRYAQEGNGVPHLPIGTAQLIDTVEIFVTRNRQDGNSADTADRNIDWAASVKLAPLFESDVLEPDQLENFAKNLPSPFSNQFARQLLIIAASGMHFVPEK